ncbi:MAG: translation initiation factor 2, partial [Paracoccaceae bacterium]|nr:translation initiation factor 2 [Paracoccaceae bacterium]
PKVRPKNIENDLAKAQSPKAAAKPAQEPVNLATISPTNSKTVIKRATEKNMIDLSRITLIGLYGTSSNRYALVRQANGRFVKVSVGDSLDGGSVAAITENELRYQKGGQIVALKMPKG